MNNGRATALFIALATAAGTVAHAQPGGLREPSRTVYTCGASGKVTYSDEPCAGALRVDVEPALGLNKSSGSERTGADVARERHREGIAEALHPATGTDEQQAGSTRQDTEDHLLTLRRRHLESGLLSAPRPRGGTGSVAALSPQVQGSAVAPARC